MIEIKKLQNMKDYKKVAEIQKSAWGFLDIDVEPHYLMTRAQKYGGLTHGLFLDEVLVGFTYAIIGKSEGEYFIYSHMTAVKEMYQGKGFGFMLKKAQREEVLKMGYDLIRWNFDPLESLNTYFNLHRLGVISREYERDIYGKGESGIHKDLSTDRLIATWNLRSSRVEKKIKVKEPSVKVEIFKGYLENFDKKIAYIEIPKNIRKIKESNVEKAYEWRNKTRKLFEAAFQKGFVADGIVFSKDFLRVFVKLEREGI